MFGISRSRRPRRVARGFTPPFLGLGPNTHLEARALVTVTLFNTVGGPLGDVQARAGATVTPDPLVGGTATSTMADTDPGGAASTSNSLTNTVLAGFTYDSNYNKIVFPIVRVTEAAVASTKVVGPPPVAGGSSTTVTVDTKLMTTDTVTANPGGPYTVAGVVPYNAGAVATTPNTYTWSN